MADTNKDVINQLTTMIEGNNKLLQEIRDDFDKREKLLEKQRKRGRLWLLVAFWGILVVGFTGGAVIYKSVYSATNMSDQMKTIAPDTHLMAGYIKNMDGYMQTMQKDIRKMSIAMEGMKNDMDSIMSNTGINFDQIVTHIKNMDYNFYLVSRNMGIMTRNVGGMRNDMNTMRQNTNSPMGWMREGMPGFP